MSGPVGRPQGGMKSEMGKAAYWRMQYESAIGALADLIAEHTETVNAVEELCDGWEADGPDDPALHLFIKRVREAVNQTPKENADDRRN